jgi:CPA1 family monovalent cation:H+ antiporter
VTVAVALVAIAATVVLVASLAETRAVSAPLVLTLVGMAASYLPGFPAVTVPSELVLVGLLPPLLYAAAVQTSLVDLGANKGNIALLSVGLVAFTAVGVGLVLWQLLDIPLGLGVAVGAVVAPPDAVAASAVARRIGLPRRIVTILEGESLFNDATALVIVRIGVLAIGAAVSVGEVLARFAWATGGGIGVGVVVAWVVTKIRQVMPDPITNTALSFLVPWIAFLPAESVHASGVLAVVVSGVLLGHQAPVIQTAQSRLAERINWMTIRFLLENAVFLLIGLQAKGIIDRVVSTDVGVARAMLVSLAVLATVVVLRPLWILPIHVLFGRGQSRPDRFRSALIVCWAGMRGVVTLAAAFSLPEDAPHRDLLVLAALAVVAGTLLLQGSTLPWLARRLDVHGPDPREDVLQTATVMQRAVAAGRAELDRLTDATVPPALVEQLRAMGERRSHAVWEQLGATDETPSETYRRIRTAMLGAERAEVLRLRDLGTIDHEVLSSVLSTLDLEESLVTVLSERRDALQERIVLTPEPSRGDCEHLREAPVSVEPVTPQGCADCLREGTTSVHLRLCLACGNVGCCDSSPGRHAEAHFTSTGHPVMRSFEPGEAWRWCYVDELLG